MPGTKGHSGGKRKGAGRPPHKMSVKNGASVGLWEHGVYWERNVGTVHIIKRGTLEIEMKDGRKFTLMTT